MNFTIPNLSIVFMAVAALMGIAIPVALFFIFRKRYKADIMPFFIGCAVFVVFAILLEGAINSVIFKSSAGTVIRSNMWLYGIFGGIMAGLFEETGRYTAFKTILKKRRGNDRNALMYAAGHGGIEVVLIVVFSMVSYIVMAILLNSGQTDKLTAGMTDQAAQQKLSTLAALSKIPPTTFLMSIVERLAAVALHISCSVLVWFAAKDIKRLWLYPLAIFLHAFINAFAVILASYVSNLWIIEGVIYVIAAACVVIAMKVWKKYASKEVVITQLEVETSPET